MLPRLFRSAAVRASLALGAWLAGGLVARANTPLLRQMAPGRMVFFPPAVPIFGDAIPAEPPPGLEIPRMRAHQDLGDHVNEWYYPALGTRLFHGTLTRKQEARLDAYRAERSRLLNELADLLNTLQLADEETRAAELKVLAAEQQPRIAALEREAEEIRQALVNGRVFDASADWSRSRRWMVGVTRFENEYAEREAQYQVVRAAAFYEDGLLPEQRGLLLEAAYELGARARATRPVPSRRTEDAAAMYFSPQLSRLRLPPRLPSALVAKVGRFNQERAALKTELRDTALSVDGKPREERTPLWQALADRQWPRFGPLEALAEEIRRELAALPPPRLSAPPHVPPDLLKRIDAYMRDRKQIMDEYAQAMQVAGQMVTVPKVVRPLTADERVQLARALKEERAAMRARASAAFEAATKERVQAMRERFDAIQESLKLVAAAQFDPETGKPLTPDTLLRNYGLATDRFDAFGREEVIYRGYRTAMLMPGLSPEQRRLLFGAALVGLAQPLPYGETMPSAPQPVPRS